MGFKDFFIKKDCWVINPKTGKQENWKGKTLYNVNTKGKTTQIALFDHINSSGEGKLRGAPNPYNFEELKK